MHYQLELENRFLKFQRSRSDGSLIVLTKVTIAGSVGLSLHPCCVFVCEFSLEIWWEKLLIYSSWGLPNHTYEVRNSPNAPNLTSYGFNPVNGSDMTTASESAGRQFQNIKNLIIPQTLLKHTSISYHFKANLVVNPTTMSDFKKALQRKHTKRLR